MQSGARTHLDDAVRSLAALNPAPAAALACLRHAQSCAVASAQGAGLTCLGTVVQAAEQLEAAGAVSNLADAISRALAMRGGVGRSGFVGGGVQVRW